VRCKINFCVLFFSVSGVSREPRGLEDWKFSYEGQNFKLPYISIWYFFWLQISRWIPKMYIFCCVEVNFKCYRLKLIKIWQNFKISYISTLFDLWLKLTFKQQNMYVFGTSEECATRKNTISIYMVPSNFDLHMRIFNLQGLGATHSTDRPKKKYTEIISMSCYNFLSVRLDRFLRNCEKNPS
jgi:hypothetical protein